MKPSPGQLRERVTLESPAPRVSDGQAYVTRLVNAVTGKGRHTSSSAIALRLPDDSGWLIDTPGVRGFGLGHVTADRVVEAFGDLAEGTAACPPGCDHLSPGCALDEWAAGHDATARLESLRRLLRSRESAAD